MESEGGWTCKSCNFLNYPSRVQCYRCNANRDGTPSTAPVRGRGRFFRGFRGGFRGRFMRRGGFSYGFYPYPPFPVYPFFRRRRIFQRENDWICSSCNAHNFAARDSCYRCHSKKDENCKIITAEMAAASLPPRREGDWDCPKCQYVNYATRPECRRCHEKKP